MALALRDAGTAGSYRRLRALRLGLDPNAFKTAITDAAAASSDGDGQREAGKEGGTPPKQQEEPVRGGDKTTTAATPIAATTTPLLPLIACLRDGLCPRLRALDIDARWAATDANTASSSGSSSGSSSSSSPLSGEPLAALAAALRQGKLRRLEVRTEDCCEGLRVYKFI